MYFKNVYNNKSDQGMKSTIKWNFIGSTFPWRRSLSDFHKMTVTVLRSFITKAEPKVIFYRDCKNFRNDNFRLLIEELSGNLNISNKTALDSFFRYM